MCISIAFSAVLIMRSIGIDLICFFYSFKKIDAWLHRVMVFDYLWWRQCPIPVFPSPVYFTSATWRIHIFIICEWFVYKGLYAHDPLRYRIWNAIIVNCYRHYRFQHPGKITRTNESPGDRVIAPSGSRPNNTATNSAIILTSGRLKTISGTFTCLQLKEEEIVFVFISRLNFLRGKVQTVLPRFRPTSDFGSRTNSTHSAIIEKKKCLGRGWGWGVKKEIRKWT